MAQPLRPVTSADSPAAEEAIASTVTTAEAGEAGEAIGAPETPRRPRRGSNTDERQMQEMHLSTLDLGGWHSFVKNKNICPSALPPKARHIRPAISAHRSG